MVAADRTNAIAIGCGIPGQAAIEVFTEVVVSIYSIDQLVDEPRNSADVLNLPLPPKLLKILAEYGI